MNSELCSGALTWVNMTWAEIKFQLEEKKKQHTSVLGLSFSSLEPIFTPLAGASFLWNNLKTLPNTKGSHYCKARTYFCQFYSTGFFPTRTSNYEFWMIVIKKKSSLFEQQLWQYSWVASLCGRQRFKKEHAGRFQTSELRCPPHSHFNISVLPCPESQSLEKCPSEDRPKHSGSQVLILSLWGYCVTSPARDPQDNRWPRSFWTLSIFFFFWNLNDLMEKCLAWAWHVTCHFLAWPVDVLQRMSSKISTRYDTVFGKELLPGCIVWLYWNHSQLSLPLS